MGVTIKAGQAYISATPSSQGAQVLRARAAADYTAYTINANASGSTKYDWIYLSVDATKANNPAADASDVTSIVTSRSSSNSTDNGSPPTYGLLLAIVTVANGASSITNSNITDKRFNASVGAQNGSLIVTQQGTGTDAIIQAAGIDANVNLNLKTKGTGNLELNGIALMNPVVQVQYTETAAVATGTTLMVSDDTIPQNTEGDQYMTLAITPKASTNILVIEVNAFLSSSNASTRVIGAIFQDSTANALAATEGYNGGLATASLPFPLRHIMVAGTTSSTTFKFRAGTSGAGTTTFNGYGGARKYGGVAASSIIIREYKAS